MNWAAKLFILAARIFLFFFADLGPCKVKWPRVAHSNFIIKRIRFLILFGQIFKIFKISSLIISFLQGLFIFQNFL